MDSEQALRGLDAGQPSLGKSIQATATRAGARGLAAAGAIQGVEDAELAGKTRLAKFGRGLADDTRISLTQGAQRATELAMAKARADYSKQQGLLELGGTLAGAATNYYLAPKIDAAAKKDP